MNAVGSSAFENFCLIPEWAAPGHCTDHQRGLSPSPLHAKGLLQRTRDCVTSTQGISSVLVRETAPSAAEEKSTELLSAVQVFPEGAQLSAVYLCFHLSPRRRSSQALLHGKNPSYTLHHSSCAA